MAYLVIVLVAVIAEVVVAAGFVEQKELGHFDSLGPLLCRADSLPPSTAPR